jgi:hypothetical protein
MRAERKAGQLLTEMPKAKGNQHSAQSPATTEQPKLSDLGITKYHSAQSSAR